ncbi:hypothetical protein SAMN05444266_109356 [Chitinophaga jiangningensis]|uniref:DUF6603 domain-containing protein n=1 Tax=Chitinophaga jiangningensis TaxID=1419482 RepID=A0A1M7KK75_9BACT|nr:DUF6603 domain-containing protein [Chitinophaga jiangningensis]SHM65334.1 hypothetical protein SAMN05444266_109356 [Chitinophaga jiangningensis]
MDINTLITQLRAQAASNSSIVLDTTLLSADQVSTIQSQFGLDSSTFLTITGVTTADIPDATANTVSITTGTVAALQITDLTVQTLSFTVDTSVDFILSLAAPSTWTWTTSFPLLNAFPFTGVAPSNTYFIYATSAQTTFQLWSTAANDAITLVAGLNMATESDVGALALLTALLGSSAPGFCKCWGAFSLENNYPYPLMTLSAPLLTSFPLLSNLTINNLNLVLTVTPPQDLVQDITLAISADTSDMQFSLGIDESSDTITVTGQPLSTYTATLENIADSTIGAAVLPSGTNFSDFIPSALATAFDDITFNGFEVELTLGSTFAVSYLSFDIGQLTGTNVNLGLFDMSGFNLYAQWFQPASSSSTAIINITANANIPVAVFTDPFAFSISLVHTTSWEIDSIQATYAGNISFSDIITEIAPGTDVPQELSDLTFGSFLVSADPQGSTFTCSCAGDFSCSVLSSSLSSTFFLEFEKTATGITFVLNAGATIGLTALLMDVTLTTGAGTTSLQFNGTADAVPLSTLITSLFADFDIDLSTLPEIELTSLTVSYNTPTMGVVVIDADFLFDNQYTGEFCIVAQQLGTPAAWQFVAFADLGAVTPVDIGSMLPLVGNQIKGDFELKDAYLTVTSAAPTGISIPSRPDITVTPGVAFGFDLLLAGTAQSVTLPVTSYPSTQSGSTSAFAVAATGSSTTDPSSVYTLQVQKNLGPIFIESIGINYASQVISCAISASMTVGPVNVTLNGFSFGSSIAAFSPVFGLNGLGFSYQSSGLSISGGIVRVPDAQLPSGVILQFDGALVVQAEQWGLSALASYAQLSTGLPSFFIFADVSAPLGGAPFFFVTGLMGGFGYNRSLAIPSFNQVAAFPLLAIDAPQTGSAMDVAMNTLQILEGQVAGADGTKVQWIVPQEGDYWVAAGISFTSFEIIQGELLVVAQFGNDLAFALLGLAWLSLPQGAAISDAFVYVELQMEAVLKPTDGYFTVAASITSNSFLLSNACHLTGGFAFSIWFGSNANAGQFVFTIGGYHPAFVIPSYYPNVARLGFNWQVSTDISITGASYFALTPGCGMAGGSLDALFQSGDVKAWFTAQADMLVTWNPFSFVADISIDIGASVRLNLLVCHKTITVSIGASLNLWGPPVGGIVKVHIVIVTVTISFGSDSAQNQNNEPLPWTTFAQLLPDAADVCKIVANTGLSQVLTQQSSDNTVLFAKAAATGTTTQLWAVRAAAFQFTTQSVVPASSLTYNGNAITSGTNVDIRPMNITGTTSVHDLTITPGSSTGTPIDITGWQLTPNYGSMAATLWGQPQTDSNNNFVQAPALPNADTIPNLITGFTVTVPPPVPGNSTGVVAITELMEEYILEGIPQAPWNTNPVPGTVYEPVISTTTIADITGIATTLSANRNALYALLSSNGIYQGSNDAMSQLAATAGNLYTATPMEQS